VIAYFNFPRGPERENKQCADILLISTSDIGIGIDDVFLLKIFEVFVCIAIHNKTLIGVYELKLSKQHKIPKKKTHIVYKFVFVFRVPRKNKLQNITAV